MRGKTYVQIEYYQRQRIGNFRNTLTVSKAAVNDMLLCLGYPQIPAKPLPPAKALPFKDQK